MRIFLLTALLVLHTIVFAQVPEDAMRYSFNPQSGTARNLAIGGAMGSLGGDITATFVNPAGLGMYRTGEFVFTPSFFFNNNKTDFRGTNNNSNKNSFSVGPIGIVFGSDDYYKKNTSKAISLVFTQTANFNNSVYYKGYNNYTSATEPWAEEAANSNLTFDELIDNPAYALGSGLAAHAYLIDTFRTGEDLFIRGLPELVINNNNSLLQEKRIDTKGGAYELALGFASNKNEKWLIGGSLGIPIISYKNTTTLTETDTSSNTNNNFGYFNYINKLSTSGVGVNFKLGVIYKPKEYIRIGLAVHTPTFLFSMTDKSSASLEAYNEGYFEEGVHSITSQELTGTDNVFSKYNMSTPWKAIVSGSYVFRETEDVTKQRAFITADIEYVRHSASSFNSASEIVTDDEKYYFKQLNKVIRGEYKGNFNFRAGGELKFNTVMGRLGFAYYSNPYKDAELKASRMLLSGGFGYRNRGYFVDLTYVHSINKDVNFPYRLGDKANTFAEEKNQRGTIVATFGVKF